MSALKVTRFEKCKVAIHIKQLVAATFGNPHAQLSNTLAAVLKTQSFIKMQPQAPTYPGSFINAPPDYNQGTVASNVPPEYSQGTPIVEYR